MKTIVLDDDPTGTQSAAGVAVLLEYDAGAILEALRQADSVYIQTNSRAIDEHAAVELVREIRRASLEAATELGEDVQFVLRGDSTLRGHVFAETEQFLEQDSVILFVPAFPAGGRTTIDGVHLVRIGAVVLPAHQTEYARDPVFPFSDGVLTDYVTAKSGRPSVSVPLDGVRAGDVAGALLSAPTGAVVLPDVEDDDDIGMIAAAIATARTAGRSVVVRSAAPLAAALAAVASTRLLPVPLVAARARTLLVCGSHTDGASAQLSLVEERYGASIVIPTGDALTDPTAAGLAAAGAALVRLESTGFAAISSERVRHPEHGTLDHGGQVMAALTTAVRSLAPRVEAVVAKGGITSAEVARVGMGATRAWVQGQVLPGVSVWDLIEKTGGEHLYVVVPGNVGGPDTLVRVLAALGHEQAPRT